MPFHWISHYIRVIGVTIKEGTEFLLTKSTVSTQKADHVIFLSLLGERRGRKKKSTGRHQNNALNAGYCK